VVAPSTEAGWVVASSLDDLPDGQVRRASVAGRDLALVRHEGSVYALGNDCPHRGGQLSDGKLQCGAELACPLHGFRYDLRTGRATMPPDVPGVRTYEARIDGSQVLVRL
jgi:nitrite reductase/ring-hydroxylating ferredoxin subunit